MRIETDAFIAMQQPGIRACIETVCRTIDLDSVRNPSTVMGNARQRSFICGLANLGLRVSEIAKLAEVSKDYVIRVLSERRKFGVRVRTQSWM